MISSDNCWLKDNCNKIDCNSPMCMRLYKLDYLYNQAGISMTQRQHVNLRLDSDLRDKDAFVRLMKIEDDIINFVKGGYNVYIHSQNCGNGKTSWALRFAQSYLNKIWLKSSLECKVLFINVPRFLLSLKDNISEKSDYVQHIKENVLTCDLVIWDEIGTKSLSTFEHENVLNLVNARIDSGKSNIYTSNLTNDELHTAVGDRLYSRIVELSSDIELVGSDKRGL